MCETPRSRPGHAPPESAAPTAADIEGALARICAEDRAIEQDPQCAGAPLTSEGCRHHVSNVEPALATLREALAHDGPVARAETLLSDLPPVGLDALVSRGGALDFDAATFARRPGTCSGSRPERYFATAARQLASASRADEALGRCADALAFSRDRALAGGLIDAALAESSTAEARRACESIVDAASPSGAGTFARSAASIRASWPAFEEVLRRDRAHVTVYRLGSIRDRGQPLPCERATRLAAALDPPLPLTDEAARELQQAWREASSRDGAADVAPYADEYRKALESLDGLVARARRRSGE